MPLIVTPSRLAHHSELYHQLGTLIAAGISLPKGLETIRRSPPSRAFRKPLSEILIRLQSGDTFTDSLRRVKYWLPSFDAALLEAGERSGRLDVCFKLLADYYRERAQLTRHVIADLAYPLLIFHAAIFISPFPQLFLTGNLFSYLQQTLGILAPVYVVAFLLVLACQGRHGETWRSSLETITRRVPILGPARRDLALARLSAALEALLSAGVSIIDAWELAATASGSPAFRRRVFSWRPQVEAGQTPSEAVNQSADFPEMFANLYHTAEISGQMDQTLRRLHKYYQEEGSRKLHLVAQWSPRLLYFGVMLMMVYRILTAYGAYSKQVGNLITF